MNPWILIVHTDDDLREAAESLIVSAWGQSTPTVVHAPNADKAREEFFNRGPGAWLDCRLIIAGLALPTDAATPQSETQQSAGLELVRRLREFGFRAPVIFTAESSDVEVSDKMRGLDPSAFVRLGVDWSTDLRRELSRFREGRELVVRPRCVNFDIVVRGETDWSWRLIGKGTEDSGVIFVDKTMLAKVLTWSTQMPQRTASTTWGDDLSYIRDELGRLLFSNPSNLEFFKVLIEAKTRVGGTENTRIRFVVNADTHPIVLEAIGDLDFDQGLPYLMLKAPVYRRYEAHGEGFPLFKDRASRRGPINCLIIEADPAEGELGAPWNTLLEKLPGVKAEVKVVHDILAAEQKAHNTIGTLKVFRAAQCRGKAAEKLEALMQETRWHLVHFAGHAIRSSDGQGAIVLSSHGDGVLGATRLGGLLSNTQFLYLSSCKSADAHFVMHLVEQKVPGVLGFRWPVADQQAHEYARHFYHSLFNDVVSRQFLEYAFLKAKRKLYDRNAKDPTWAAPVLIMQVDSPEEELAQAFDGAGRMPPTRPTLRKSGEDNVRNATELRLQGTGLRFKGDL
jgi:hypothetical protein